MSGGQINTQERVMHTLRGLYQSYGYQPFKVNKFEEYDLYAQNKKFLTCQQVLTFSDTDGRLMALKPDVTLSIVKNTKDCARCFTMRPFTASPATARDSGKFPRPDWSASERWTATPSSRS